MSHLAWSGENLVVGQESLCKGLQGTSRDPIQDRWKTNERRMGFLVSDIGILEEMAKAYPITSSLIHRGWESWTTGEPSKLGWISGWLLSVGKKHSCFKIP